MTAAGKRRFIAGARCPACGAIDKIVLERHESGARQYCVDCGYEDSLQHAGGVEELETRVNTPRPGEATLAHEIPVDTIKILDD